MRFFTSYHHRTSLTKDCQALIKYPTLILDQSRLLNLIPIFIVRSNLIISQKFIIKRAGQTFITTGKDETQSKFCIVEPQNIPKLTQHVITPAKKGGREITRARP